MNGGFNTRPDAGARERSVLSFLTKPSMIPGRLFAHAPKVNSLGRCNMMRQGLMQEVCIPMILMDSDGFILGLNRAACECLKYDLGDVAQKTIVSITDESDQQREVKNSIDLFYGRKLSSIHQKKFVS